MIAPDEEIVKLLPTLEAAKAVAMLLVKDTLLAAPLLDKVMAPVNTLALFKVIALLPALKLDVPVTDNVSPVACVIAPPAVADRLPVMLTFENSDGAEAQKAERRVARSAAGQQPDQQAKGEEIAYGIADGHDLHEDGHVGRVHIGLDEKDP